MILQHLNNEGLEAVKKDADWSSAEKCADLEVLWKLVVQKHKIHPASKVKHIVKLST